jgi:hypothetical protein
LKAPHTLLLGLGWLGVRSIDQVWPFHSSAKVTTAATVEYQPTAVQNLTDKHDTPDRELIADVPGMGRGI